MANDLEFFNKDEAVGGENKPSAPEHDKEEDADNKEGLLSSAFDLIQSIAAPMLIVVLLLTFAFRIVNVDGTSMLDTLHDQDKVFVTNFLYQPQDGDIVVISHGQEFATPIIKRVIATAGQSVRIDYEKNQLIVDGIIIDEPYINEAMQYIPSEYDQQIPEVIPEGKVFVMGDNRNHSLDSRSKRVGLINETDIIGKAQFIIFPFSRFGNLY